MNILDVYHGTKGDNILQIIKDGAFRPDEKGELYFVQHELGEAFQHGADEGRMACYVLRARVEVPLTATIEQLQTPGALHTLRVKTALPLSGEVTEMYIRKSGSSDLRVVKGSDEIAKTLKR